jgi:hypothetical protein
VNGTATDTTDLFPSQTAISLYYTATGSEGPGQITGSATLATKTPSAGSGGSTGTGGGSGSQTSGGSAGSQSTSTSSSKSGAAPTGVWMGGLGLAAGVVGMVIL